VNNVISETAPSVTVIDGVESLRICEAAKRSADNGGAEVLLSNIE
jgi:hypothetical protein